MLDDWLFPRFEFDRCIVVLGGASVEPLREENDWLRLCAGVPGFPGGEVTPIDLGLAPDTAGDGEGDIDSRLKGLLRHLGPLVAVVDMTRKPFAQDRVAVRKCCEIPYKDR